MKISMVIMVAPPTLALLLLMRLSLFMNSTTQLDQLLRLKKGCDMFKGTWVPHSNGTYYTNETCPLIIDQQNCLKFGKPETEFLNWRWKPDECDLPRFDAVEFLEIVRGKSVAFVGDSVGNNQMQSLLCLLYVVSKPEDITSQYPPNVNLGRWLFPEYNFTLASFWAPFLVKSMDSDTNHTVSGVRLMTINLDEPEPFWASEIGRFDFVIISAGQWFYRPMMLREKGNIIGCCSCGQPDITELSRFHVYGTVFRTTFRTLMSLKGYKGTTFLRTFSPSHFENGPWNDGGSCPRTKPFGRNEMRLGGYELEFYLAQVEEFRAAEREGRRRRRGLEFKLLDTTRAMLMRPDGHPNSYGHSLHNKNKTVSDCVHWCVPGPVDTWNEFFLHLMQSGPTEELSQRKMGNRNG